MHYPIALIALVASINASPVALTPKTNATASSASKSTQQGCFSAYYGDFGMVVLSKGKLNRRGGPVSQIPDGQIQNYPPHYPTDEGHKGGYGNHSGGNGGYGKPPVHQIPDGQIQNGGDYGHHGQDYGHNEPDYGHHESGYGKPPVYQIPDGQVQNGGDYGYDSKPDSGYGGDYGHDSGYGSPSYGHEGYGYPPVLQIPDGQIQNGYGLKARGEHPINQIPDGQIQNGGGQGGYGGGNGGYGKPPVNQIPDGQIQTGGGHGGYGGGNGGYGKPPVNQIPDGQIQNGGGYGGSGNSGYGGGSGSGYNKPPVSQIGDGQIQNHYVARNLDDYTCKKDDTLTMSLFDGILKDKYGRTGYIADNFQFQFDGPPQAGAIITSGFQVCDDGSLSLNGKNEFFQCASGDFYNLYDRWWADQCEPVTLQTIQLHDC